MGGNYAVGVDLGGTKILAGVVDTKTGRLVASKKKKTKQATHTTLIERITSAVNEAMETAGIDRRSVGGIGVGAAGMVDRKEGVLLAAANLGINNVPITEPLNEYYGVPTKLGNDVEVATLAEKYFGAGRNCEHFACVFVGTGIGSGIVVNGELIRGATGTAGEVGHTILFPDGRQCGCGHLGCLEAYASRTAIAKVLKGAIDRGVTSSVASKIDETKGILRSKTIAEAIDEGDKLVSGAIIDGARYLGIGLASVVNFFNPERIILGGGLVEAVDLYFETVKEEVKARSLPIPGKKLKVVKAGLGDYAGIVGAALLVTANGKPVVKS